MIVEKKSNGLKDTPNGHCFYLLVVVCYELYTVRITSYGKICKNIYFKKHYAAKLKENVTSLIFNQI